MTVIELPIPDEMDKAINSLSSDKKGFIIEAIKQKLQETQFGLLKDKLIEGYSSSHHENSSLTNDFNKSDLENWDEY
jgi:hypothetical protein